MGSMTYGHLPPIDLNGPAMMPRIRNDTPLSRTENEFDADIVRPFIDAEFTEAEPDANG
tara:strand:+ start:154 stop:330 length:177 start_codon:yes stop_codon:yes gene_type:complete